MLVHRAENGISNSKKSRNSLPFMNLPFTFFTYFENNIYSPLIRTRFVYNASSTLNYDLGITCIAFIEINSIVDAARTNRSSFQMLGENSPDNICFILLLICVN